MSVCKCWWCQVRRRSALVIVSVFLIGCGDKGTTTEYVDTCGSDSPAIVLPDEIVCNHSDSDMVEVVGAEVVYLCVKQ